MNPGASGPVGRRNDPIQIDGVEATACQYGGEYPWCNKPPSNTDGGGTNPPSQFGGSDGSGTGDAGSGGGGGSPGTTTTPTDSTAVCDPTQDPNCEKVLTKTDSTTIVSALNKHVRAPSEIADTAIRRKCGEMHTQFLASYGAGKVFRGSTDSDHFGMTAGSHIHFDSWLLDAAVTDDSQARELANTALHEAAHVLLFSHPNGHVNGVYTDQPFNLLPPGAGPCIK